MRKQDKGPHSSMLELNVSDRLESIDGNTHWGVISDCSYLNFPLYLGTKTHRCMVRSFRIATEEKTKSSIDIDRARCSRIWLSKIHK
jgi:hypothetical protein